MLTLEQAINDQEFHYEGPIYVRRMGKTKIWKTRPGEFRIPVAHGLRGYDSITQDNARMWHSASECLLNDK